MTPLGPPPVTGAAEGAGAAERAVAPSTPSGEAVARSAALSGSGLRTYTPTLWRMHQQREERPRYERDSLRSRSKEGRPGSRKHRRYTRSVEVSGVLRKAMALAGEEAE